MAGPRMFGGITYEAIAVFSKKIKDEQKYRNQIFGFLESEIRFLDF